MKIEVRITGESGSGKAEAARQLRLSLDRLRVFEATDVHVVTKQPGFDPGLVTAHRATLAPGAPMPPKGTPAQPSRPKIWTHEIDTRGAVSVRDGQDRWRASFRYPEEATTFARLARADARQRLAIAKILDRESALYVSPGAEQQIGRDALDDEDVKITGPATVSYWPQTMFGGETMSDEPRRAA